jgi:hypothetical protein
LQFNLYARAKHSHYTAEQQELFCVSRQGGTRAKTAARVLLSLALPSWRAVRALRFRALLRCARFVSGSLSRAGHNQIFSLAALRTYAPRVNSTPPTQPPFSVRRLGTQAFQAACRFRLTVFHGFYFGSYTAAAAVQRLRQAYCVRL